MIKHFDYETKGTCCTAIHIDVEDDKVVKVQYDRGCPGNIQGIM
ncbi:MAG: TSCPD domain-containing protein, partial [Firmicutes bacterium]|nr:TSCPD domain-containing protein [Bacillota bacterium]